jgi:hypothetical protein
MEYGAALGNQSNQLKVQNTSLMSDTDNLVGQLIEAEKRLISIGDRLLGPEPREATGGRADAPEPIQTVRRNIDNALRFTARLHEAITRLESRV